MEINLTTETTIKTFRLKENYALDFITLREEDKPIKCAAYVYKIGDSARVLVGNSLGLPPESLFIDILDEMLKTGQIYRIHQKSVALEREAVNKTYDSITVALAQGIEKRKKLLDEGEE